MTAFVEAKNLKKTYWLGRGFFQKPAPLMAVGGISFALDGGKTLAVVGESGSGKSTLARLITLIEPPTEGGLVIDGINGVAPPGEKKCICGGRCRWCFKTRTDL